MFRELIVKWMLSNLVNLLNNSRKNPNLYLRKKPRKKVDNNNLLCLSSKRNEEKNSYNKYDND